MKPFKVCSKLQKIEHMANAAVKNCTDWGCKRHEGTTNKAAIREMKTVRTLSRQLQRSLKCR